MQKIAAEIIFMWFKEKSLTVYREQSTENLSLVAWPGPGWFNRKSRESEVRRYEFEPRLCNLLAIWLRTNYSCYSQRQVGIAPLCTSPREKTRWNLRFTGVTFPLDWKLLEGRNHVFLSSLFPLPKPKPTTFSARKTAGIQKPMNWRLIYRTPTHPTT